MDTSTEPRKDAVELRCAQCGKVNRVRRDRLHDGPVCGACKRPLAAGGAGVVTDATWAAEVERSTLPVLVDFWAPWCGPCRAVAPMLEQVASERAGRLKVVKLNVDENPMTASRFAIQAIPTLMIFRAGQVVDQIRGAVSREALQARLDRL